MKSNWRIHYLNNQNYEECMNVQAYTQKQALFIFWKMIHKEVIAITNVYRYY